MGHKQAVVPDFRRNRAIVARQKLQNAANLGARTVQHVAWWRVLRGFTEVSRLGHVGSSCAQIKVGNLLQNPSLLMRESWGKGDETCAPCSLLRVRPAVTKRDERSVWQTAGA